MNNSTGMDKGNKIGINFLLIGVIVVIVGVAVFAGYKFIFKGNEQKISNGEDVANSETSFFIRNEHAEYALFNDEGKQLTDFIYGRASKIVNGASAVSTDNGYEIISSSGKTLVKEGTYKRIESIEGLYKAVDDEGEYSIIDKNGKVLYEIERDGVVDHGKYGNYDFYSIIKTDKEYIFSNYAGKKIFTLPIVSGKDEPITNNSESHIMIFYNNKNYLVNLYTGKTVASFESTEAYYSVHSNESKTLFTIIPYVNHRDDKQLKIVRNGKVYDIAGSCDGGLLLRGENIICENAGVEYLVDKNNKPSVDVNNANYVSIDEYATSSGENTQYKTDFYKNGKLVKQVDCRYISIYDSEYVPQGLFLTYASKRCNSNKSNKIYEFYNSDGENAFNKSFATARMYDENNLAVVSDEGKNYYLIDAKGKQVGEKYSEIIHGNNSKYYSVENNNKGGLIDNTGKIIIDLKHQYVQIKTNRDSVYAVIKTTDDKYKVYDINKKKDIIIADESPTFDKYYITAKNGNKVQYYTYSGKMLFEA